MADKLTHIVRFEPVGIEMEIGEGETVLNAAFRQGVALMHGCKEGQCASCKSILREGDIELLKYSTFALSDSEREQDKVLLCKTQAYSDLVIELLNFDEYLLSHCVPVRSYQGIVKDIQSLTHDIRQLRIETSEPMKFFAGQYVDVTVPETGVTRSFSMANPPSAPCQLEFIIEIYQDGAFSSLLRDKMEVGHPVALKGPFGTCMRHEGRESTMLLTGGGSGMAPLLSILMLVNAVSATTCRKMLVEVMASPVMNFLGEWRPMVQA